LHKFRIGEPPSISGRIQESRTNRRSAAQTTNQPPPHGDAMVSQTAAARRRYGGPARRRKKWGGGSCPLREPEYHTIAAAKTLSHRTIQTVAQQRTIETQNNDHHDTF
jgi:hypothetical protein